MLYYLVICAYYCSIENVVSVAILGHVLHMYSVIGRIAHHVLCHMNLCIKSVHYIFFQRPIFVKTITVA